MELGISLEKGHERENGWNLNKVWRLANNILSMLISWFQSLYNDYRKF